jgi:hypothetical protein
LVGCHGEAFSELLKQSGCMVNFMQPYIKLSELKQIGFKDKNSGVFSYGFTATWVQLI